VKFATLGGRRHCADVVGALLERRWRMNATCSASVVFSFVRSNFIQPLLCAIAVLAPASVPRLAHATSNPWADQVISFTAGVGASPGFSNPAVTLGSPERFTGEGVFPGAVTPFNSAFGTDEIFSIGRGGSLVVRFDEPIINDPANPFGIDLLIFGNSFFFDPNTFEPIATTIASDGGTIEVSADGVDWRTIPNLAADGLFPTLGYSDLTNPFQSTPGNVFTNFTRPVDPSIAWQGMDLAQLTALYNGSGGGAGVDIGLVGLTQVSFVRISLASTATGNIEIDGFSDVVPAPGSLALLGVAGVAAHRRRRLK